MKKLLVLILALACVFASAMFVACDGEGGTNTDNGSGNGSGGKGGKGGNVSANAQITVTFDTDGGSNIDDIVLSDGNMDFSIPEDPEKEGYEFNGWTYDGEFIDPGYIYVQVHESYDTLRNRKLQSETITFTASWRTVEYYIYYELNGGEIDEELPSSYNVESDTITFATPIKSGYNFKGWSVPSIATGTTGDITVTATWSPIVYNIFYEFNGGSNSLNNPITYTVESGTIYLEYPEREGFDSSGWYEETTGAYVWCIESAYRTGDIHLTTEWSLHNYDIHYDLDGGSLDNRPTTYTMYDQTITFGTPTKAGYDFVAWDIPYIEQGSTGDKFIKASWSPRTDTKYNVHYYFENLYGWYEHDQSKDYETTGTTGEYATYNKTFDHFTFNQSQTYDQRIDGYGTTVVEVYFNRNSYSLTVSKNTLKGGVNCETDYVYVQKYGSTLHLETTFTSDGYSFDGWYIGNNAVNTETAYNYTFTEDAAIVATWSPNTDTEYTVCYHFEDAEGNWGYDEVKKYGTTDTTVTLNETFDHYIITNSNIQLTINGDGSSYVEVYYRLETFTVKIKSENVKISKTYEQDFRYGYVIPAITAEYDDNIGVEWLGWYTGNDLKTSETEIPSFTVEGNVELIAKCSVLPAFTNFIFESTKDTCIITGVIDKTVSEIVVPDVVTEIGYAAFNGCSNLTKITLPFAGRNITGLYGNYNRRYTFGIIFGIEEYEGASAVEQTYRYDTNQYGNTSTIKENYYIPDSLKTVILTGGALRYHVFENCAGIENIILPEEGLTVIEQEAFKNCSSLKEIVIPDSVTSDAPSSYGNTLQAAFSGCSSLESVVLGSGITELKQEMFKNCTSLTSFTIPATVTTINMNVFLGCANVKSLTIPATVTNLYHNALGGMSGLEELTLNELRLNGSYYYGLGSIMGGNSEDSSKFYQAEMRGSIYDLPKSLKKVTVLNGTVAEQAFRNCSYIEEIVIGSGVQKIEITNGLSYGIMSGCGNLKKITIPFIGTTAAGNSSVQYPIGVLFGTTTYNYSYNVEQTYYSGGTQKKTFAMPRYLTSITVDSGNVNTTIYANAFVNCTNLEYLRFEGTIDNVYITPGSTLNCPQVQEVIIGDGVQSVSSLSGFINLRRAVLGSGLTETPRMPSDSELLTEVILSEGLETITYQAFWGCDKLTIIVIPNSVITIGNQAFAYCTSLESITIGSGVNHIYDYAFRDCTVLKTVIYNGSVDDWVSIDFKTQTDIELKEEYYSANPLIYGADLVIGGEKVTSANISGNVTEIMGFVFYNYAALTEVNIPSSVVKIGDRAFKDCTNIATVNYGGTVDEWASIVFDNAYTFFPGEFMYSANPLMYGADLMIGDEKVTEVTFDGSMTEIGAYAFNNYKSLTEITIPESVTSIGKCAFRGCENLATVNYGGDANLWAMIDFADKFSNPLSDGGALVIGGETVTIVILDSATAVKQYAFYGYSQLEQVTLFGSVKSVEQYAFADCPKLYNVYVYASIESVGWYVFDGSNSINYKLSDDMLCYLGNPNNQYLWLVKPYATTRQTVTVNAGTVCVFPQVFKDYNGIRNINFADTTGWTVDNVTIDVSNATSNITYFRNTAYYANKAAIRKPS